MLNLKHSYYLILILLACLGASCVSQREMSYLREVTSETADTVNQYYIPIKEAYITSGDILTILVNAIDLEAVQVFNLPIANVHRLSSTHSTSTSSLQGYWVNPQGNINFPVLGEIHVAGMTTTQLQDTLETLISASVVNPIVNVSIQNFYVTVLGEVRSPGRYNVNDQHLTILDAISLAGDLNIYGKRNNVLVAREVGGVMQFERLNLNDHAIYGSPFFHLRQNDVIYVEPNNARSLASQNVPLYLSIITSIGSMTTVILSIYRVSK